MSETTTTKEQTMTQLALPGLTDAELAEFVAWQGSDADALAPIFTDRPEPEPEEARESEPELDWPIGYGPSEESDNPYVDDYDRCQDDLAVERYERTFRD